MAHSWWPTAGCLEQKPRVGGSLDRRICNQTRGEPMAQTVELSMIREREKQPRTDTKFLCSKQMKPARYNLQ